jgi:hypothetical protein
MVLVIEGLNDDVPNPLGDASYAGVRGTPRPLRTSAMRFELHVETKSAPNADDPAA